MICVACSTENTEGARFCNGCGARLAPALPRPAGVPDAERRQLTVLFCDVVDSTRLAAELDLDDWRQLLHRYQDTCAAVVARLGGHIAQYLGDGVVVYFGYPASHEDDGLRAVRAGLRLIEAVSEQASVLRDSSQVNLRIRVGIHSGLVVIGDLGMGEARERLALGVVPNLAARIQAVAEPNSVVISATTHGLARGFVDCGDAEQLELAGFSGSVTVHRVRGETDVESRIAAEARRGLAGLVGRRSELERLLELWRQAREGKRTWVLLSGEPGIGKSRQIHAFKEQVAAHEKLLVECRCSLDDHNSAFRPILNAIERQLLGGKQTEPHEKLSRLEHNVREQRLDVATVVPLLAPLFALPLDPERHASPALSPLRARELTLLALSSLLLSGFSQAPALLVIEDLHWADASTLDLLRLVLNDPSPRPALVILSTRPSTNGALGGLDAVPRLTLDRLGRAESWRLAENVAGSQRLPRQTLAAIADKSDGIPLFVEELTRAILESGVDDPTHDALMPTTLRGLLAARLDRTREARNVAQLASVLGREFSLELLRDVSPAENTELAAQLECLVRAGLVVPLPDAPAETYAFKHALIRDAAYDSLLRHTRTGYHLRIAEALVAKFPALVAARPELVAEHYRLGEQPELSLRYWQLASERGLQTASYREAVSHLRAALTQLEALGPNARPSIELMLRSKLGQALIATEVEQNFARATELGRKLCAASGSAGDKTMLFVASWGLWAYHVVRADFGAASLAAEQLEALASQLSDAGLRLEAHVSVGMNLLWSGAEPAKAEGELVSALALHHPERHRRHPVKLSQDAKICALAYLQWLRALAGDAHGAFAYFRSAEQHLRENPHPYSAAFHAAHAVQAFYLLGDEAACVEQAELAARLGREHGFPIWLATGGVFRGWCLAQAGEIERAQAELEASFGLWQKLQIELNTPTHLEVLSRVQELGLELETALTSVERALTAAERTGELFYVPELLRRRGALLARLGKPVEAEATYRRALGSASARGARLFELRAVLGLAELLTDRPDERRALLLSASAGFPEQARLAELSLARTLLAER
jgi:class 3 adenylate cyclase/predicted ATPase